MVVKDDGKDAAFYGSRNETLKSSITSVAFNYVRRGLFERDKLTITTMFTFALCEDNGTLSPGFISSMLLSRMEGSVPEGKYAFTLSEWIKPAPVAEGEDAPETLDWLAVGESLAGWLKQDTYLCLCAVEQDLGEENDNFAGLGYKVSVSPFRAGAVSGRRPRIHLCVSPRRPAHPSSLQRSPPSTRPSTSGSKAPSRSSRRSPESSTVSPQRRSLFSSAPFAAIASRPCSRSTSRTPWAPSTSTSPRST
jgi:hypothetical protein